jgi:hypothetical protein
MAEAKGKRIFDDVGCYIIVYPGVVQVHLVERQKSVDLRRDGLRLDLGCIYGSWGAKIKCRARKERCEATHSTHYGSMDAYLKKESIVCMSIKQAA